MNSWKEGVAKKLSHLLSDRPSPPPLRTVHSSSSFCPLMPQELPIAEDGVSSAKGSTFSSVFLSKFPASCSTAAQAEPSSPPGPGVSPPRSHSRSWKSSSFGFKVIVRPFKNAANGKLENNNKFEANLTENADNVTERSVNATKAIQGLTSPNASADCVPYLVDKSTFVSAGLSSSSVCTEFLPYLLDKSTFLSADLFEFLHACLPNIVKGCQWMLLYRQHHEAWDISKNTYSAECYSCRSMLTNCWRHARSYIWWFAG